MAENKFYDICVRGRLGVWLGLLAILAIMVLATFLSKDEQTGNSDKQEAGFGQGGLVTDEPVTDKPVTDIPITDKPVTGKLYIRTVSS